VADGVVDALTVEARNVLLHAFKVFGAALGLHEAEEVTSNLCEVVIAAGAEEIVEVLHEGD
jgi:hypothetical protein